MFQSSRYRDTQTLLAPGFWLLTPLPCQPQSPAYFTRVFLGILDRYLLKNFLLFFGYSMFGILGIWLVYQLGVEGPRFLELHLSFRVVASLLSRAGSVHGGALDAARGIAWFALRANQDVPAQ